MISIKKSILTIVSALSLTAVSPLIGQEVATPDMSRTILPSVVSLNIQRADGGKLTATAFLGVKDGMLVTALHVLRDATRVTATFPNGEEFDCIGLIDKDERRNLALVRVRSFGRPLLKVSTAELAAGAKVICPVVKDGAFGVIESTIADVAIKGGIKFYKLGGVMPPGNAGSPIVDAKGEVVGVHVTLSEDGKDSEMALPSAYIMGLEASLAVQPWTTASSQAAQTNPAQASANAQVDAGLAAAFLQIRQNWAFFTPLSSNLYRITRYSQLRTVDLYKSQSDLDGAITRLGWLKPTDPLRATLAQAAGQLLAKQKQGLEYDITCYALNKNAPPSKHIPQAEESAMRAAAVFAAIPEQVVALHPDLVRLAGSSPAFLNALSVEMRYFLGLAQRKSRLVLGVYVDSQNPFFIMDFVPGSLGEALGFRIGDLIVSAAGRPYKETDDLEDFKLQIEASVGKALDVVVNRGGKQKSMRLKVPKDVLEKYSRPTGGSTR